MPQVAAVPREIVPAPDLTTPRPAPTEEPKAEETAPAIKLISVQNDPAAASFMTRVMGLTSAEVRGLIDRLHTLPGTTPEAQAIMMKLNFRLDQQDLPYLLDLIDNPALTDESKDNLVKVVGQLNNPAAMGALQNLVRDGSVKDGEPLFHAAVKSLVRSGSEEALASVFARLAEAKSEDSTNVLVTLLVEHRNPAAEGYLHKIIKDPASNYYVGSTAVYMLANHPTQASASLLQELITTNSAYKSAASEALARQNPKK